MNTKRIAGMSIMSAFSLVLLAIPFLRIAPFPIAPFLEYDAADIPIMLATFIYGVGSGLVVTFVVSIIQGLAFSASGIIGIVMHILATGTFVLTGGFLFKFLKKKKTKTIINLILSVLLGSIGWLISMILYNIIFTPIFMGVPLNGVFNIMLPAIIPFNLLKAGVNGVVASILYITLSKYIMRYLDNTPLTDEDIEKMNIVESNDSENKN